ncbi:MAG: DNA adenine methylase [Methanobrevibacter sp.]|nr:DNA adenine methylase [Methanobrevibacter sp.]
MTFKFVDEKCAKPFLKWAGGKKQVIDFIDKKLPIEIKTSGVIDTYVEPFLGGGAVFFYLFDKFKINNVYLSDINKDLMLTFNVVKNNPKKLILELEMFADKFLQSSPEIRKEYYYNVREDFNECLEHFDYDNFSDEHIIRASQMIFLNKTCFNGLYRVNKSGKFNVPIGKYKNPLICDKKNLLIVSDVLKNVNINCCDYSKSEDFIDENSFVYLDPPYLPIKKTSFTNYHSQGFGVKEQIELSQFCKKINDKGAKFILSNSDPKNIDPSCNFFEETYGNLKLNKFGHHSIQVKRSINSKGNKRGPINELLIYNY